MTSIRTRRLAVLAASVPVLGLAGLVTAVPASASTATHVPATAVAPMACHVPAKADDAVLKKLLTIGRSRHINIKVTFAEFETAWVESHANNLPCGDADSVGVFQQRPSAGWGTKKQCMNVKHATNAFLDRAIAVNKAHPDWTSGHVSWYVQQPAKQYRHRYSDSKEKARSLIRRARKLV